MMPASWTASGGSGCRSSAALTCLSSLLLVLCAECALSEETLVVPDDYDTIQEAIEEAVDGDIVLVAAGTYEENIDFLGKAITVESEDGAVDTVIDGGSADDLDFGSVVQFVSEESSNSVLEGFTLVGGTGAHSGVGAIYWGGGVYIDGSAPTIRDCIVRENEASSGGGLFAADVPADADFVVSGCTFEANEGAFRPGGVFILDSTATLENCRFVENSCSFFGAGFGAEDSTVSLVDCEFLKNSCGNGLGGAVGLIDSVGTFIGCTFEENEAGYGAGIQDDGGVLTVDRCFFFRNDAGIKGGAIVLGNYTLSATVNQSTIFDNTAGTTGGVHINSTFLATLDIKNSILWSNEGGEVGANDATSVTYSLVDGGHVGEGNIDEDPLFDGEESLPLLLTAESPAIDAGDPEAPEDLDGTVTDLGAVFFDQRRDFKRGDADGSGSVFPLVDALFILDYAFLAGSPKPPCMDAADCDGNGEVFPILEATYLLDFGFRPGAPAPPAPGPSECGHLEVGTESAGCEEESDECA